MRTLSRGALAVVLSITGLAAPMAASAALSRAQLEDLEHHLWQVRTDYHMYAVMDGNDTYRVALNEAAQQAAEALDELRAASESDAERALVADLADQWQRMAADQALPAPGDAEGEAASGDPRRLDDLPAEMAAGIDDFEIDARGDIYATTNYANLLVKIDGKTGDAKVIAGGAEAFTVAGASAAAFGRTKDDKRTLYMSTATATIGNVTEGGRVLAVEL